MISRVRLVLFGVVGLLLGACGHASRAADAKPAAANTAPADAPSGGDAALHAACCKQCASAASRDPAGMDISTKDCRSYAGEFNGGPGVDDACVKHFGDVHTTLGECWKLEPATK
jgi:hypothetical protein